MAKAKITYNDDDANLFCNWCKEPIAIGEKYLEKTEDDGYIKSFHLECVQPDEEFE